MNRPIQKAQTVPRPNTVSIITIFVGILIQKQRCQQQLITVSCFTFRASGQKRDWVVFYRRSILTLALEQPDKDVEQPEGAEGSEFNDGDEEDGEKKEYVKKDFVARPYISDGVTEEQVNSLIIKNTR